MSATEVWEPGPNSRPEQFPGRPFALIKDFFAAFGKELGGDEEAAAIRVGDLVKAKYARTRL